MVRSTCMDDNTPKIVSYRLLVPFQDRLYKIGQITIKNFEGDIFYTPSQAVRIKDGQVHGTIDHVSFHKSGRKDNVSVKFRDIKREILTSRLPIKNIGYQLMFEDSIFNVRNLPEHTKKVGDGDLIFDPVDEDIITLRLSIISGRLIVEPDSVQGVTVTQRLKDTDPDLLTVKQRCLGWHSGNADKMMQYSLSRGEMPKDKDIRVKRTLFIPACQGIERPNREE